MRKYVWAGVALLAVAAAGGFVHAHTNRASLVTTNQTTPSTSGEWQCPLSWLMSQCGLGCCK
jgi:hypothetical protein